MNSGGTVQIFGNNLNRSNSIQEKIKSRLKAGIACYHSVQNLLSSNLLSKNIKIVLYRTTILPVVLYGCETWSLTSTEECGLRLFENKLQRRIFGLKRNEGTEGENYKLRRLMICTPQQRLFC
jgi:hypothetical protein